MMITEPDAIGNEFLNNIMSILAVTVAIGSNWNCSRYADSSLDLI